MTAPTLTFVRTWPEPDGTFSWACSYEHPTCGGVRRWCGKHESGYPDQASADQRARGHQTVVHGGVVTP